MQLDEKSNNDVEVSWEDQQRINRFSRLHATFSDVEEELKARRTEREELDDLGMELELLEDERILYVLWLTVGTRWAMHTLAWHRRMPSRSSSRTHSAPTRSSRASKR